MAGTVLQLVMDTGLGCARRTNEARAFLAASKELDRLEDQVRGELAIFTEEHKVWRGARTVAR